MGLRAGNGESLFPIISILADIVPKAVYRRWNHLPPNRPCWLSVHPGCARDHSRVLPNPRREWHFAFGQAALILSKQDKAFAKKRMELEGRAPRAPYTKAKFKKIFTSWHIYVLSLLYV